MHLLSTYYAPSTVRGTGNTIVDKGDMVPNLEESQSIREEQEIANNYLLRPA